MLGFVTIRVKRDSDALASRCPSARARAASFKSTTRSPFTSRLKADWTRTTFLSGDVHFGMTVCCFGAATQLAITSKMQEKPLRTSCCGTREPSRLPKHYDLDRICVLPVSESNKVAVICRFCTKVCRNLCILTQLDTYRLWSSWRGASEPRICKPITQLGLQDRHRDGWRLAQVRRVPASNGDAESSI